MRGGRRPACGWCPNGVLAPRTGPTGGGFVLNEQRRIAQSGKLATWIPLRSARVLEGRSWAELF